MITFAHESWDALARDAATTIFPRHWRDLALDQEAIELDVDLELYSRCDKSGNLYVVTARDGGTLIGYIFFWLAVHPHYKKFGLQASTDAFYLLPEHRKGGCGAKMLMAAEQLLREHGVKKVSISTKVHDDRSAIFTALGWKLSDKVFGKIL